jgi:hypothetical protein
LSRLAGATPLDAICIAIKRLTIEQLEAGSSGEIYDN